MRISLALTIAAAGLSASACAAGQAYGTGLAYGYDSPYDYTCYPNAYGYGYGYGYGGYGLGTCGWYDGFFYPGFGEFVFDRHHHRHDMTMRQHDYFTRQGQGPDGGRRVGLGSSGGVVPPTVSRPQQAPGIGAGHSSSRTGIRNGFGGGARGGFGGSHRGGRHG
jgi:hypothetical protein